MVLRLRIGLSRPLERGQVNKQCWKYLVDDVNAYCYFLQYEGRYTNSYKKLPKKIEISF